MTRTPFLLVALALMCLATLPLLHAQALPPLGNNFFSVTITRNDTPLLTDSIFKDSQDHLIIKGTTLAAVIGRAYGLRDYQIVDGPDWVYESHLYDIEALPPPVFVAADEVRMLQNMLADRFALDAHMTTRDITLLTLVRDETAQVPEAASGVVFIEPPARHRRPGPGMSRLVGRGSMQLLATRLSHLLGEPVLDMTGMDGSYEFQLEVLDGNADSYRIPLREQLGVKLELRAVPLEVMVLDRIARPALDQGR
jgi:uncharacterized protein (TIGR03435 family)